MLTDRARRGGGAKKLRPPRGDRLGLITNQYSHGSQFLSLPLIAECGRSLVDVCEHNNPDSLDARLFPSVVLAAVTIDEASSRFPVRM